jgi:hypothetical protein
MLRSNEGSMLPFDMLQSSMASVERYQMHPVGVVHMISKHTTSNDTYISILRIH